MKPKLKQTLFLKITAEPNVPEERIDEIFPTEEIIILITRSGKHYYMQTSDWRAKWPQGKTHIDIASSKTKEYNTSLGIDLIVN